MSDVLGLDFLTNPKIAEATSIDLKIDGLESVELPSFVTEEAPAPKLVPNIESVGPMETSDGLKNLNAVTNSNYTGQTSTNPIKL